MTRIVIFGAGFLGHRLRMLPGAKLLRTDIVNAQALKYVLEKERPEVVINAAGKTGKPNVDWCEAHQLETYRSNVVGALTLAEASAACGAHLVHLGSGCIFYGSPPGYSDAGWHEDDPANPSSFYSRTKYAADLVLARLPNVCVARIRMPIDSVPHPRNLITKLASYREVADVRNSVTVVEDLIAVLAALIEKRATGVFHVTNPGAMRHSTLLALYREYVDRHHTSVLIPEADLVAKGLVLKARSTALLADSRLAALGIRMRPIEAALRATMQAYAHW